MAVFMKVPKMIKRSYILFMLLFSCVLLMAQVEQPYRIVIDPGHGGKDPGTSGSIVKEKDIVLDISIRVKAYLDQYPNEFSTNLTRSDDRFIPLHERSQMANEINADLFLSIHCNHFHRESVNGTEVYVMGLHKTKENLAVAKRENQSILLEQDYQKHYDGYDPNSIEGHIMLSMFQSAYLLESIEISSNLLNEIGSNTPLEKRKVKQAGFVVLRRASMPSALLEVAFLSNHKDQELMRSTEGRDQVAKSIANGILSYYGFPTLEKKQFTIQLCISENEPIQQLDNKWAEIPSFTIEQKGAQYYYITHIALSESEVNATLENFKKIGFTDAKLLD